MVTPTISEGSRSAVHCRREKLQPRERAVIDLRYRRGLTQAAAAKILGVSQVQVSRLERKALDELRRRMQ